MVVTINAKPLLSQIPSSGVIVWQNIEPLPPPEPLDLSPRTYNWSFESRSLYKNLEFQPIEYNLKEIIDISHPTVAAKQGLFHLPYYRWKAGVKRISLFNLPIYLSSSEIKQNIQISTKEILPNIEILDTYILESQYLTHLNCSFASVIFEKESDAKTFWEFTYSGNLRFYGHNVNAIPDCSGYGIFAQAAALLYSPTYKNLSCLKCNEKNRKQTIECQKLVIPDITREDFEQHIKPLTGSHDCSTVYQEDFDCGIITYAAKTDVSSYCLQKQFKLQLTASFSPNVSYIKAGNKVATCIFDGLEPPINHTYKAALVSSPQVKTDASTPTAVTSVATSPLTPQTLPGKFLGTKKRAKTKSMMSVALSGIYSLDVSEKPVSPVTTTAPIESEHKLVESIAQSVKRGRGRPRGSKKQKL